MSLNVLLFKDSNCDLCKIMQQELMDNPPAANVTIIHVNRESCLTEAEKYKVSCFPTILLVNEDDTIFNRFEGFVDSKSIDINIKQYETECMVQVPKSAQV